MGDPWKLVEDSLSGIFQNKKTQRGRNEEGIKNPDSAVFANE